MKKIIEARALENFRLWLRFSDGYAGIADLSDLAGKGVFAAWSAPGNFAKVKTTDFGAVAWGDNIDLCPDDLYLRATGKRPEELFPSLRAPAAHA